MCVWEREREREGGEKLPNIFKFHLLIREREKEKREREWERKLIQFFLLDFRILERERE